MNDDTRSLTELLQRATPEPAVGIDFDLVAARVRRRRTTSRLVGSGAVLATCLTIAGSVLLGGGDDDRARDSSPGPASSASPNAVTISPTAGCPATTPYPDGKVVEIDWVPFIQLNGQEFDAEQYRVGSLTWSDLGAQVATVTCRIADLTDENQHVTGEWLDGNAAFLAAGTPVYAVAGYDPACRVAAIQDGLIDVYLTHHDVNGRSVPTQCALKQSAPQQPVSDLGVRAEVRSHCGVLSMLFLGQLWLADPPLGDNGPPPGWGENTTDGAFFVTAPGKAEFRTDGGERAEFKLAEPGTTDPGVNCE